MKALILSGGKGTRLRPITYTSAKQLVPIANKPILFYGIESLIEAGITDIGIVVGDTSKEVQAVVGNGEKWGVKITYIEQEAPLGLAHAVMISEDFIGDSNFVMYLGDNIIAGGIKSLVDDFEQANCNCQILLSRVDDPQHYGIASLVDGKVAKLYEKPNNPTDNTAIIGVYMFDKHIFKGVKNIKPSGRNELEITDAIQYLIENGYTIKPHFLKNWWKDTGQLEDMLEANRLILDHYILPQINGSVCSNSKITGKVNIDKGAKIKDSIIRGPVVIGEDAIIEDSFIGPYTSIGERVTIKNSEIDHSIILQESEINVRNRIESSLIGKNVKITESLVKPKALKIMVGDNSQIEVF